MSEALHGNNSGKAPPLFVLWTTVLNFIWRSILQRFCAVPGPAFSHWKRPFFPSPAPCP